MRKKIKITASVQEGVDLINALEALYLKQFKRKPDSELVLFFEGTKKNPIIGIAANYQKGQEKEIDFYVENCTEKSR